MNRMTVRFIALLLALIMVVTACGDGDDPTSTPPSSGQGSGSPTATTARTQPTSTEAESSGSFDRLVFVTEAEPETFLLRDACSIMVDHAFMNIYEGLTDRTHTGEIVGKLAESFERVDDTTWRFYLREGVTFHNGEVFNADAVVTAVDQYNNPDVVGRCGATWQTVEWPAVKVDEYTVDLKTLEPDPILPTRIVKLWIPAPEWITTVSEEEAAVNAIGTGPYQLIEWDRGSRLLFERYDEYWGEQPDIAEVELLGRNEASVRAAMLQSGEAHVAYLIPPELVEQIPNTVTEVSMEFIAIRLNAEHDVLSDIRVREAIALSIDTETIIQALFPGGSATVANGQIDNELSLGYNPELEPYPYDPERAMQLIEEAGATGATIELIVRSGGFPMATEVGEAIANMISEIGLDAVPVNMEAELWREQLYAAEEGQTRPDMLLTGATNSLYDSSRQLEAYYGLGRFSHLRDEEVHERILAAAQLSGEEREQAYQQIWADVYEDYHIIPLFGLDFVHGLDPALEWEVRAPIFADIKVRD